MRRLVVLSCLFLVGCATASEPIGGSGLPDSGRFDTATPVEDDTSTPIEEDTGFFWTSGRDGKLRMLRCASCELLIHPPAPICPGCLGREAAPSVLSGRGTVHSYTVNHQPWDGVGDRYVIALVTLDEQDDVRLTTNLVGIEPDDVRIGMPVEVVFEDHDPVYIPLFRPVAS